MTFSLAYIEGDLTNPADGTVLVHACNCQGQLGAGVARAMNEAFPLAHKFFVQSCKDEEYGESLRGECLLVPPQIADPGSRESKKRCWIACLLTSHGYGSKAVKGGSSPHPKKDGPDLIKKNTRMALESLRKQMEEAFGNEGEYCYPEVWSNRMNAGFFGVEWAETEKIIEEVFEGMNVKWSVVDLAR